MAESEKGRGKAVHEIILETERGRSPVQGQINRIIDEQTEMIRRQLEKSQMEQLLKESERKSKEEDFRMRKVEDEQKPLPTQPEEKTSEAKNILDAVRIGVEVAKPQQQSQGSMSEMAKSLAEMFKVGVEIGKGSQPQQPQQNSFEMMKQYHEMFLKPVLDQLNSKEKEMMTMRMNQIENKITAQVSPQEYIKQIKESANTLGLTGGGRNEIDLKLAEMSQTERLENRKLDWEVQKHQEDKEGEKELYGLVGKAIDGPIADLTKSLGGAAARRIESGTTKNPNQSPNNPQLTQVSCPQCTKPFQIITGSQQVVCPHCNAILGLQQSPQPQQTPQPQEQPPIMQPQETQTPPPTSEAQQPTEASQPVQSEQPKQ